MELSKRCFYHFCRKSAIEKDLKVNFFPSKMGKFLLDITEGWLEFKKSPIDRFFLWRVKDGELDPLFLTSTFNFKLKEISNYFVDGWYDAFEEGVKRL